MKGLDLSKFKKISSDNKCTTLQHPDGHTIKIALDVLKPEMRSELNKIPIHKASGGMIKKYADGGDVNQTSDQQMRKPSQINSIEDIKNMLLGKTLSEQSQGQNNQQVPAATDNQNSQIPVTSPQQIPSEQISPPNSQPAVNESQTNNLPQQQLSDPQPTQTNDSDEDDESNVQADQSSNVPAQQQGLPSVQNQTPEENQVYQKSYKDYYDAHLNEMSHEDAAFDQDIKNGHITPETYHDLFAKKDTLGKIGMIFGMMASSMGSGLSHQPNAMLQMMNNQIQNDLDAQKQSKSNAQNFLRIQQSARMLPSQINLTQSQANLANSEADVKNTALANMNLNRAALDKIANQVKSVPPGPERAKQEQALAMMYNSVNNENFNIASRAAAASAYYSMLMGQSNPANPQSGEQSFQQKTNGMRLLGPQGQEMAKNMEEKHFPGLKGQASVPLSGEDRDSINSGITFDQKLHRFIDWTKSHSGDLSPQDRNAGQALAAELQGAYRQATHGGVYKEGEQNFISKLIDNTPTKFFNEVRVIPQLNAIANENNARVNQLVKSKGFDGYEGQKQNPEQNTIERIDPKSGRTVIYDANTKKPLRWK